MQFKLVKTRSGNELVFPPGVIVEFLHAAIRVSMSSIAKFQSAIRKSRPRVFSDTLLDVFSFLALPVVLGISQIDFTMFQMD